MLSFSKGNQNGEMDSQAAQLLKKYQAVLNENDQDSDSDGEQNQGEQTGIEKETN